MGEKMNAPQRIALSLGLNIAEVETLRDRIDELMLQMAERDATIIELRKKIETPETTA